MTETQRLVKLANRNLDIVSGREVDTRAIEAAASVATANALLAIVEELHIANLQRERAEIDDGVGKADLTIQIREGLGL